MASWLLTASETVENAIQHGHRTFPHPVLASAQVTGECEAVTPSPGPSTSRQIESAFEEKSMQGARDRQLLGGE